MNVMFVCTGNTCRSPMAKGLLEKEVEESDSLINVDSAGLSVYVPAEATENAVLVMDELGIDISDHKSCQITKESVIWADLVLAMTSGHRNILIDLYPEASDKIYTISEYAYGTEEDVADPFGGDAEEYRQCALQIKDAVNAVYSKIKESGKA